MNIRLHSSIPACTHVAPENHNKTLPTAVISGTLRFPSSPPVPKPSPKPPSPKPPNPRPPRKGRASCLIVLFSQPGHRGVAYRSRLDWFSTRVRRTYVAPRLELSNGQGFTNRTRSFAVLCDCDELGFDCNSHARSMRVSFFTSPLRDATSVPTPAYTWNFAVRTSPRCQANFCDIMYKQLPPRVDRRITGFRFTFNPPVLLNTPENAEMLRINAATTQVMGRPDITIFSPRYNAQWLRRVARGVSVVRAKPGSVPQLPYEVVANVPDMSAVSSKTRVGP